MTEEEFWAIWKASEPEYKPLLFRLYYNDQGYPIAYSHEDLPGQYIDIDPETFRIQPKGARVIDGQLMIFDINKQTRKLVPGAEGTGCDSRDVCVILKNKPNTKWSLRTYESY